MTEHLSDPPHQPNLRNPDLVLELGLPPQEVAYALHPPTLEGQGTVAETIASLHGMPFLSAKDVQTNLRYSEGPTTSELVDDVTFPVARIVGVRGFDSWAGRGLDQKGRAVQNGGYSSASAVHHYANRPQDPDYAPQVTLFKDADGEVWGFTDLDGAHRTAGAKARGDTALHCTARIDDYDKLPEFEGSVSEALLKQEKYRDSFIGKALMKRQARALAKASERFDIEAAERRAALNAKLEASGGMWTEL